MKRNKKWEEWLWDAWCVISVIGIWPRFIEPHFLQASKVTIPITHLPSAFENFTILQLSDLHWDFNFPSFLLKQLKARIQQLKPDLIVFTGDLLCRAKIENMEALKNFLVILKAPAGCYAILGNHDYDRFVSVNAEGDFDVLKSENEAYITTGFKRLFNSTPLTNRFTLEASQLHLHSELLDLWRMTSFKLLNNETIQINHQGSQINLCGLEDYLSGRFDPVEAFKNYKMDLPGVILSHNPDSAGVLQDYPGDLMLCGHTHGGEINLPFLWKRFCHMEIPVLKRGLKWFGNKWIYTNRGINSIMKFRWFALPELTILTLKKKHEHSV